LTEKKLGQTDEVTIYINERNLIDLVREVEMPLAIAEGHPKIAGGYFGLSSDDLFLPSKHLLGEPIWGVYKYHDGKVSVLECECGAPGCWPFLVNITVDDDRVVWSGFEQPHRSGLKSAKPWTYDALKPFVSDKGQYLAELEAKTR